MCDILVSKCDSPFNAYAKGILAQKRDTMTDCPLIGAEFQELGVT
jgi:hypothetical protein